MVEYKATKDDVRMLLHHYQNLYADTVLLTQFCGEMRLTLRDGFRSVCEEIQVLEAQLATFTV